jgi:phosphopantothenoylcysteine decarboxylase/phosphopantothenate--cysteine ligase
MVTAGPTYEALDPVRFLGNHSSGKMGIAIAEALFLNGANVHLISGPVRESVHYKGIRVSKVTSAKEMYDACLSGFAEIDIAVMAAAVADYTFEHIEKDKIKKNGSDLQIVLTRTKDILKTLGLNKKEHQILVGFALETNNEEENARRKLKDKNADFIVLNSLKDEAAGFNKDTNKVTIFESENISHPFAAKSKRMVATDIVELIIKKLNDKA